MRGNRPSIFQIGKVHDVSSGYMLVTGWGLGSCVSGCSCHRHPTAGHLAVWEDAVRGTLGLVSYAAGGCHCCEPWTAIELAAFVQHLADTQALEDTGVFDHPAEGAA